MKAYLAVPPLILLAILVGDMDSHIYFFAGPGPLYEHGQSGCDPGAEPEGQALSQSGIPGCAGSPGDQHGGPCTVAYIPTSAMMAAVNNISKRSISPFYSGNIQCVACLFLFFSLNWGKTNPTA